MFFKGAPWDIVAKKPTLLEEKEKGLWAFSCYDPFIEKIMLGKVPKSFFGEDKLTILHGKELTVSWFEDNIQTMDFFTSHASYLVLMADEMPKAVSDYLASENIDWGERFFILSLGQDSRFYKQLEKSKRAYGLKVEIPKFWEGVKLLQFLCHEMKITLSYDVQSYIADSVVNDPGTLIQCLKKVRLFIPSSHTPTVDQVKEIIERDRIDQFHIANLYGEKKWRFLFEELLVHARDFDGLISLFRFLQGHLLKIADPSYMNKKNRLTKYDKGIQAQCGLWTPDEINEELVFLNECETFAKTKSHELTSSLRLRLIRSYG